MSKRSKKTDSEMPSAPSADAAPASVEAAPASVEAAPASAEAAPASAEAPASVQATPSTAPKKKKKKKARKSKAPSANGTLDLTPSTAPPVAAAPEAPKQEEVDPDDVSVPPAEDLDHDFFRASAAPQSAQRHEAVEPVVEETRDPRIEQLMTAEAKRRRAHFTKYVKAAVAISIVLCIAAVVRVGIRRNHGDDTNTAMAATSERPTPVVVVPEPAKPKPVEPPPVAEEPTIAAEPTPAPSTSASAEPAKPEEPAPSASAVASAAPPAPEPSASAVASAAPSGEPTELDPKAALKEKRKSQQLLDQGKVVDAIEHGEQSVKFDPTDAEAWLILGAAYQMKGDMKEARRCFRSCIQEGKRGPKGECMAMPH